MTARIAILLCMKENTPSALALRAIRSTASSLAPGDLLYLRVDGGQLSAPEMFRSAAAPATLVLREVAEGRGLAHGLNQMVEEALRDPGVAFLARMDADDESLPGRMQCQRQYMAEHPDVDILGTACHEVDEYGAYLQLKRMPISHAAIVATLPRSNPLNHPTVMLRRRVFECGLRYREDVKRTEDYHFWIAAASSGFIFANLEEPWLNFQRDSAFFRRRGGWFQAWADLHVRLRAMRELRLYSLMNLLWAVAAFSLRIMPATLQKWLYCRLR
ncbi:MULTISPECIES: glycosyltransferase [unclassified Cyanobium]|uniref:glycosyltransferase n=1 Tax=unclassified Cyanobium TaxID=2627006 RepID=UPI0020CE35D4|nr:MULTISPECIES: glycosyltransferase [unclassified Cyanobium]MCP9834430.1 glycosyltransferase [Cyanobium sp. La Preciosa 7G6]MCP9937198.1 glycosyltransferase [Cyanobium sp. Aljojuca 7A6]